MADISLNTLYEDCKRTFKMTSGVSSRFDADFPRAVNRGINRINMQADLETPISLVDGTQGTVELDSKYEYVLYDLTVVGLMKAGQRPAKGMEDNIRLYDGDIDDRIDDIRQDILNKAVVADSDDETDFVGLGALNA